MGNSYSSKGTAFLDEFSSSYTFDRTINDPRLGQISLFQSSSDSLEYVAVKEHSNSTLPQASQEQAQNTFSTFMACNGNFIDNNTSDHPNVAKVFAVEINQTPNNLKIYYEHFHTSIRNQIELRTPNRFHFSPEEIWRTLLSVIMAGYYLETQGRYIGEVSTRKIYINKKGIVKLIPHLQSENDMDSFRRIAFHNQPACVAPECLEKIRVRSFSTDVNHFKNDVFGLGLSILEMASLEDALTLYDFQAYTLHEDRLAERIAKAQRYYGNYFKQFLEKMLVRQEQMRFSFSQLFQELLPFQQQIITGYKFCEIEQFRLNPPQSQLSSKQLLSQKQLPSSSTQTQLDSAHSLAPTPLAPESSNPATSATPSTLNNNNSNQIFTNFSINLTPCLDSEQQQQQPQQKLQKLQKQVLDSTPSSRAATHPEQPWNVPHVQQQFTSSMQRFDYLPTQPQHQPSRTQIHLDYTPKRSPSITSIASIQGSATPYLSAAKPSSTTTYVIRSQQQQYQYPSATSFERVGITPKNTAYAEQKVVVPVKTISLLSNNNTNNNSNNQNYINGQSTSYRMKRVDSNPSIGPSYITNPSYQVLDQPLVMNGQNTSRTIIETTPGLGAVMSTRNRSISPQTVLIQRSITPNHRVPVSNSLSTLLTQQQLQSQQQHPPFLHIQTPMSAATTNFPLAGRSTPQGIVIEQQLQHQQQAQPKPIQYLTPRPSIASPQHSLQPAPYFNLSSQRPVNVSPGISMAPSGQFAQRSNRHVLQQ